MENDKNFKIENGSENIIKFTDKREIKEFLEDRNIRSEDLEIIDKLAGFPKDKINSEFHNFFNSYRESSGKELEIIIKSSDGERKELYETMFDFYKRYDWAVCWNLERLLESVDR